MVAALQFLGKLLFLIAWARAQDCLITTRQEANQTIIIRDCSTTVVVITCDLLLAHCIEESYTKTATSTKTMTISSTLTATSITSSTTTATTTSATGTSSTTSATLTTSSTSTRTSTTVTNVTQTETEVPIVTTSLETTSDTSVLVSSSTLGEMVLVEGVVSFAQAGVSQEVAEAAVASTLSRVTGILPSRIRTSALAFAKLRRRLSGIWRVNFEIDVLATEEAAVIQRLQQLKNSESFADNLKEELQLRGGDPASDFNVGLALASDQGSGGVGGGGGEGNTETIIIIAAVVACVIMAGAFAWKVCSGEDSHKESDELLKTKEDTHSDRVPARSETSDADASGNGYERGSDADGPPPLEPNSLAVGVGSAWADGMSFYPGGRVMPEREESEQKELSEPPMPPPAESPTIHGVCYEVPEETDPINLTDVQPEVTSKRQKVAPQPQWSLQDHQLTQAVCRSLTPSCWTGSLVWTELPHVQQTVPLPLSKEYKLNFQRTGRLAGHCFDSSSQYKITGKHRESGELSWREVPQSSAGMAIECHGRIHMRGTAQCNSFEIVGVFSAVSTTISARHLGSGRFNLTTSVRPTAFGNTSELL